MKSNFILFHGEGVNADRDSLCHLILVPVIEGEIQPISEFIVNPESDNFEFVMSGLSRTQVESSPKLKDNWSQIQQIFDGFDTVVCSGDGYSARLLYNSLSRLGISINPINYYNSKAILRKTLKEVSYNFDFLNFKFYSDCIEDTAPVEIAKRWCQLTVKALNDIECDDIPSFALQNQIKAGLISDDKFIPSKCIKIHVDKKFDASTVELNVDEDNPFFGMSVVFTGKLESMTRTQARSKVISIGGSTPTTLTTSTNYLVVGNQDLKVVGEAGLSGKMKKAAQYKEKGYDIEIINEQEFLEMIGNE